MLQGSDDIASRAIELLKETFTSLGPKLRATQVYSVYRIDSSWALLTVYTELMSHGKAMTITINITSSTQRLCECIPLCHFGTYTLII